jgi:hypothetical protein
MREAIEEAFWNFMDQKWRDALNVAAAEAEAAMHVAGADEKRQRPGDSGRRCIFADVMGCMGMHSPWHCKLFGRIQAREREKIIEDNRLCPFCLLHDRAKPCGARERPANLACHVPDCKGRHIRKLYELLKDLFRNERDCFLELLMGGS